MLISKNNMDTCTYLIHTLSLIYIMKLLVIFGIKIYQKLPIILTIIGGGDERRVLREEGESGEERGEQVFSAPHVVLENMNQFASIRPGSGQGATRLVALLGISHGVEREELYQTRTKRVSRNNSCLSL
jgi:hypothetical protein